MTKYILMDDMNDEIEEFDSEAQLEEFLKALHDEETVEDLRVFEVETEYTVKVSAPSFQLEEVE